MIPKKIHYCWFGKSVMPEKYKKNIESWKKYMPEFKIIQWDESNYDVHKINFTDWAYKNKKWAFVSDYARLDIVANEGGIYLDVDVEVLRPFNDLLNQEAFMGIEYGNKINTGLGFGAIRNQKIIVQNKSIYETLKPYNKDGDFIPINCPEITTKIFLKNGAKINNKDIENIENVAIYPTEYFCPMDYRTGKTIITNRSYSIHKYNMSWCDNIDKKVIYTNRKIAKFLGIKNAEKISKILFLPHKLISKTKKMGVKKTINYYINKNKTK